VLSQTITNDDFPLSDRGNIFDADGNGVSCEYVFGGINGGTVSLDSIMKPGNYRFDMSAGTANRCFE
jgi:hypothetical protein